MRTRTKSIVAAFVLLSLVSGAIGCRSNGGPWYNPKSYTWHNPLKSSEAPPYGVEGAAQANTRPSMGAQPNVNTPPGGYTNKEDEARFLAGKKDGTVLVPQYGATLDNADSSRVASSNNAAGAHSAYPETANGYNPYSNTNPYGGADTLAHSGYQQTNLHTAGVPQQTGVYPGTGTPGTTTSDPMVYPGTVAPPSAAGGYSPYSASVPERAPIYGDPAATNPMTAPNYNQTTVPQQGFGAQPAPTQGFGTQPAAPQYDYQSAPQQGFGTPMGTAAPANPNLPGYTAAPSVYPASSVPQGF